MEKLTSSLNAYRQLLEGVDRWFTACLHAGGSSLACRAGCRACCRGLFDITLLDAWMLKNAFASLSDDLQAQVLGRCQPRLVELQTHWPELSNPYLLNSFPEEEWLVTPEEDQTPCPLLDEQGYCLVYASRPLTCRLHGLPNIDLSGEDFDGTVCTLHAGDPEILPKQLLRWRFRQFFSEEISLFQDFTRRLTGKPLTELDTFIPLALLADYTLIDWQNFRV